jgi:glutaconate CoA-transferase subunit A
MPGEYFSDEEHLREWLDAEKDPDEFKAFVNKNIYDCINHEEYINRNGGMEKIKQLRKKELLLHREEKA